jgi:surface carbohydrate biosynthesis protein
MPKKPTILITIEHKEREYLPKSFLAYELAKTGYRIYFGSISSIDRVAKNIEPSIFFHKSTFYSRSRFYKSLGHTFAFMDEEGGVTTSRSATEAFCKHRYRTVCKEREDVVFLPGERFEKHVLNLPNIDGVEFHTTGWPRVDLWREEFYYLYDKKVKEIRKEYGSYYLMVTSFGMTNDKTYKSRIRNAQKYYLGLYRHKYYALLDYLDLIKELSVLMQPSEKLIIRPHPSESLADWKDFTKNLSNVIVVRDGDIAPWILASDGVVQYGSTTATQAALNGVTCIQYKIDWQKGITDTPSFELCVDSQSPEEVYELLKNNIGKKNRDMQEKAKLYLKEEMAFDEDELSVNKIVEVIKKIQLNAANNFTPSFIDNLIPILRYAYAHCRLSYYKLNKFAAPKKTVIDKIPGGIKEEEVQAVIDSFIKNNGSDAKIECTQITKDLVCIESINSVFFAGSLRAEAK